LHNTGFHLYVPRLMTLNDIEWLFKVTWTIPKPLSRKCCYR